MGSFLLFLRRSVGDRLKYVLLAVVLLILTARGYYRYHTPIKVHVKPYVLWATGQASGCSFWEAAHFVREQSHLERRWHRLRESSKIVQTDGNLVRWQTPDGVFWARRTDDPFYILAEQEGESYAHGNVRVRPGDIVLDCGANIGDFVAVALRAGASLVVAIEPSAEVVECLRRNFAGDRRVIVYPKGVWHEQTTLKFWSYPVSALDSIVMAKRTESPHDPIETRVDVTTIDSIMQELTLSRVDFIKMDIEGAEPNAIRGARETIRKHRPRMALATENLPQDYEAVPAGVAAIASGYRIHNGPCRYVQDKVIRPGILFFEP